MVRKRIYAIMLILLLSCPRKANTLGLFFIGYYVVLFSTTFFGFLKIREHKRMQALQEGVDQANAKLDVVDGKVTVIDTKVDIIDSKITEVDQNVKGVQQSVNNFEKKTEKNFEEVKSGVNEVKSEVSASKITLMNELANKEKILSDLIQKTEQNLTKESKENYDNLFAELGIVKSDIKLLATKEDMKDLKESAKVIEEKLNNLKNEISTSIKELESNQKKYLKDLLEEKLDNKFAKAEQENNNRFVILRGFIEKLERKQTDSENNFKNFDAKLTNIVNEVKETKSIIMGKHPVAN